MSFADDHEDDMSEVRAAMQRAGTKVSAGTSSGVKHVKELKNHREGVPTIEPGLTLDFHAE